MVSEYEKQVIDFLEKTKTSIKIAFKKYDYYFPSDKEKRDVYSITLTKGERAYAFDFGNSLANSCCKIINKNTGKITQVITTDNYYKHLAHSKVPKFIAYHKGLVNYNLCSVDKIVNPKEPTAYDVLACLDILYADCNFDCFCSDFGYDTDSRQAEKTYKALLEQSKQYHLRKWIFPFNHPQIFLKRQK